jgi:8-oxo-dGTP pyrophosphatase MutT (NUDIX family)
MPVPNRDLRVGVCCVVEHKKKVLITRRAATLRTFPLKWVFPGGHVNFGERLEDAGAI